MTSGPFGDPATIQRLATAITTAGATLDGARTYVAGRVAGLVPRSWSGPAADAFASHWSGESFDMSELTITGASIASVLTQLATVLDQANQLALAAAQAAGTAGGPMPGGDPLTQQAQQMAQQAWLEATMQLAGQTIPQVGPATTPQQANAWATGIVTLPPDPTPLQQAEQTVQTWWNNSVQWVGDHHTDLLNLFGDAGWMTLGVLGMVAAGGIESGGLVLDASGAGAIFGVPLNLAGAGLFAASFTATTAGGAKAVVDLQHLFSTSSGPGSTGGTPTDDQIRLRQQYLDRVQQMHDTEATMRQQGASDEQIARKLVDDRNAAKVIVRSQQDPALTAQQEARNLQKYGNPVGPTADQLLQKYGSWEEVIKAAYRTDPETNRFLGLNP